jgi:hypothetical protein
LDDGLSTTGTLRGLSLWSRVGGVYRGYNLSQRGNRGSQGAASGQKRTWRLPFGMSALLPTIEFNGY